MTKEPRKKQKQKIIYKTVGMNQKKKQKNIQIKTRSLYFGQAHSILIGKNINL